MKRALVTAALALTILAVPAPAHAQDQLSEAADAVKSGRVYVAAGTEMTDVNTVGRLKAQLTATDNIALAMLPRSAHSEFPSAADFAAQLDDATGHRYIIAVAVGSEAAATSRLLPEGKAVELMGNADRVSTNPTEALITFVRYTHSWQAQNPEEVAKRQPPKETATPKPGSGKAADDDGSLWGIILLGFVLLCAVIAAGAAYRLLSRATSAGEPKIKVRSPDNVGEHLERLLELRIKIKDQTLRDTITQLVRDTEVVFRRLRANTPSDVQITAVTFEVSLRSLCAVVVKYIEIQDDDPRYYEDRNRELAAGKTAVEGFATYALSSAQRAGRSSLTRFRVDTQILDAQRYS